MRYNAYEDLWEMVEVFGEIMLFKPYRIDRQTVPDGVHMYEVRHSDEDWGEPCEIANGILVNFFGTLLSRKPLSLEDTYLEINPEEDWGYEGAECALEEYLNSY